MHYSVARLDPTKSVVELEKFCKSCKIEGITNNSSIAAMKIGMFEKEAWWVTRLNDNQIISASGMYHFPEISKNCWRVLFRTATLTAYRGLAGPVSKKFTHDFNWAKILPLQLEYGKTQGADMFVFTTNSAVGGDPNSLKTNRIISRALVQTGMIKLLHQDMTLYNTQQNVWQVLT